MASVIVAGDTSGSCTLQAPAVSGSSVLTLPVATDTLVGKATTDTLTNKSIAATQLTGTLAVANGGTGVVTSTGSGAVVLGTSPTLTTPTISSLSSASATALTLQSAGTTAITVDTSQNVGIGTTAPSQKLEIYATANSLQIESVVRNDQAGSGVAAIGFNVSSTAAAETTSTKAGIGLVRTNAFGVGSLCFYNNNTGSGGNFTTADERMRIDSNGNLLVGTTSQPSSTTRLVIKGASTGGNYGLWIQNSAGTETFKVRDDGIIIGLGVYGLTTGSAANMHVATDGVFYRSTSSLKYKTNVQDATHGLTDLLTLRPVTYKGKNDGDIVFGGLIAEEVHEVGLTEFVQYAEDGSPDSLAYGNMISLCIKAIQELKAIIDTQAERIKALENKS